MGQLLSALVEKVGTLPKVSQVRGDGRRERAHITPVSVFHSLLNPSRWWYKWYSCLRVYRKLIIRSNRFQKMAANCMEIVTVSSRESNEN